jgi:hypothetical protein
MITITVGETHVTFDCTWTDESGPVDLTNPDTTPATLSVRWHTDTEGHASRLGDGTFTPLIMNKGRFRYAVSADDVTLADLWRLQFKATYADATVRFSRPIPVTLEEAL